MPDIGNMKLIEQAIQLLRLQNRIRFEQFEHGHDILLDRQAMEYRRFLRQISKTTKRTPV